MQEQEEEEEEEEIEREEGGRGAFFKGIINSLNALVHSVVASSVSCVGWYLVDPTSPKLYQSVNVYRIVTVGYSDSLHIV